MSLFNFMYRQLTFKPESLPPNISLTGQTILITGSNTGIGLEATRELLDHGPARVILAVRSLIKGETARESLLQEHSDANIDVWELDCESFDSIVELSKKARGLERLDSVILNAGISKVEWSKSPTGHETTVQVNHLATALLSLLLLPRLQATSRITERPSRLIITSSVVHGLSFFKERNEPNILKEMDKQESFAAPERYNTSKLLNVLWTRELASRISKEEVIINTVNPGLCSTALHREDTSAFFSAFLRIFAWAAAQGGLCLADAALLHNEPSAHGAYITEQAVKSPSSFVSSSEGASIQSKVSTQTIDLLKAEAPEADLGVVAQ